jgi:putative ABC transport system permease protein
MLRHYLAVAIRHLHRRIGYSVINIMGLGISLTWCILLTLYIRHELSYDRFHQKADQIYRIAGDRFAATPAPWAPALVRDFSDVLQAVRIKAAVFPVVCTRRGSEFLGEGLLHCG